MNSRLHPSFAVIPTFGDTAMAATAVDSQDPPRQRCRKSSHQRHQESKVKGPKQFCFACTPLTVHQRTEQICRKRCGLGCVTCALARAQFTQPSPHIFLYLICTERKANLHILKHLHRHVRVRDRCSKTTWTKGKFPPCPKISWLGFSSFVM